MSALIEEILEHNRTFVAKGNYAPYDTSKYPDKKLAVVSCMDTRLIELLPAAMGLKNGDAKMIKNAGGIITHPFGSVMRSLLIAVYQLKVETIAVVGHYDCGMQRMESKAIIEKMLERGIKRKEINLLNYCGINLESWLKGFENSEEAVQATMGMIIDHPLMPEDIKVYGFLIDPNTGRLDKV
jgi:carbonic anhydrase